MRKLVLFTALCAACGPGTVKVTMNEENHSGENGTATLTDMGGGQTKVVISLTPGSDTGAQHAHIHIGTCPGLIQIIYPLTDVQNGTSTSTVAASLSVLESGAYDGGTPGYVINVHNSMTSTSYVSCGSIP